MKILLIQLLNKFYNDILWRSGYITNSLHQDVNHLGKTVSTIELQDIVEKGLIYKEGKTGRGIKYTLKK